MCGVFLDISKAFDKVWHHGLLYKLKRNSINGDWLKLIESFWSDRYNLETGKKIATGVPEGSILRIFLF